MGYTSGMLKHIITGYNRTEATQGRFGLDTGGVEWESAGVFWANCTWSKGKSALNAGALDAYSVILVRMRWTDSITARSRIDWDGQMYQIEPETFHPDRQENTLQFVAQLIINED